ncbi:subtilisin-like protease SBT3.4 [Brachypodium distachyon]|uniref:Inhibitor I9 domain-containing protein n=1 Tax=Brachypodium distachyon TaxID=15368 RepID=A0A0Q3RTW5_BRADI|nr:subtilisin-like protease SBT3.4 [Brachypodium distachyon]KQK16474.1 hypothetical protein BRADI_1g28940v3 [Brachypodium distachyon]|eukprot:XP_010238966.1 subtilisin-like protease SBT3.4 [Brachypodium distachyon]
MRHASATAAVALALALVLAVAAASREKKHLADATACVYVVMVKPPAGGVDITAYHIDILATVLGRDKAKEALVYSYKSALSGFAAKLTPAQVAVLQKHPNVIQALPDKQYSLHDNLN